MPELLNPGALMCRLNCPEAKMRPEPQLLKAKSAVGFLPWKPESKMG